MERVARRQRSRRRSDPGRDAFSRASALLQEQIGSALQAAYAGQPFIRLLGANQSPDTKNVVGTNFVDICWAYDARAGRLILMSTEDNIGKGASSHAVQNMNLICGYELTAGLSYL